MRELNLNIDSPIQRRNLWISLCLLLNPYDTLCCISFRWWGCDECQLPERFGWWLWWAAFRLVNKNQYTVWWACGLHVHRICIVKPTVCIYWGEAACFTIVTGALPDAKVVNRRVKICVCAAVGIQAALHLQEWKIILIDKVQFQQGTLWKTIFN